MTRSNLHDTQLRTALESIAVELAVIRDTSPITRLRMVQAMQRTGLITLLDPALIELDEVVRAAQAAQSQVVAALEKLLEK